MKQAKDGNEDCGGGYSRCCRMLIESRIRVFNFGVSWGANVPVIQRRCLESLYRSYSICFITRYLYFELLQDMASTESRDYEMTVHVRNGSAFGQTTLTQSSHHRRDRRCGCFFVSYATQICPPDVFIHVLDVRSPPDHDLPRSGIETLPWRRARCLASRRS